MHGVKGRCQPNLFIRCEFETATDDLGITIVKDMQDDLTL